MRITVRIQHQKRRFDLRHCTPTERTPASLPMKVPITMTVRDFSGSPYPKGSVFEAHIAPNGALEVVGAQHLPLRSHEWSLVLTDEDL